MYTRHLRDALLISDQRIGLIAKEFQGRPVGPLDDPGGVNRHNAVKDMIDDGGYALFAVDLRHFIDLPSGGHLIKGAGQLAQLVIRIRIDSMAQIAACECGNTLA